MRLKPIKPGMVIHCKNDMEYEQLNAEVIKLGYGSLPCKDRANQHIVRNFVFYIETDGVGWEYKNEVAGEITEFSDLIIPELSAEEAYNKGLNDAWEMAKKIALNENDGGISTEALRDIFDIKRGLSPSYWVFKDSTIQDALAKLEAYEKSKEEIKVGDVVFCFADCDESRENEENYGVVTGIYDTNYQVLMKNGDCVGFKKSVCEKTGKHIDISAILAEIGKE